MRGNPGTTFLFWLMFVLGGANLGLCLLLPAWLEYRELTARKIAWQEHVAALDASAAALEKQRYHLENDPAYLQRLARLQFGLEPRGVESALVEPVQIPASQPAGGSSADPGEIVERAAQTHPLVSLYVMDQTRPVVMGMSGLLVLAAIVLLNRGAAAALNRPAPD
jgi:hypothetical protein